MITASQPIDRTVLDGLRTGDESSLERLFRDRYATLTNAAVRELGDAGPASAPRVVERVFMRAWEERSRFETPEALDAFLRSSVHEAAVRERSRLASLHRRDAHDGRHAPHAARAIEPLTPEEAWKHIHAVLHAPAVDARTVQHHRDEARHEAAHHFANVAKPRSLKVPLIVAGVVTALVAGGIWWVEGNSADVAITSALASSEARLISSRMGQTGTTTLSDGSRVTLAADSRLTIAPTYTSTLRAVKLEGAASFDVATRANEPFALRVRDVTITVTGTTFDVAAYPQDPAVILRVRSGSVTVRGAGDERSVEAGRTVAIAGDGAISDAGAPAVAEAMSWADGRFVVEARPLGEVLPLLQRWYTINLTVRDSALLARPVTASVPLESSREAIAALETSARVKFDYEGKTMVLRDAGAPAPKR